MIFIALTSGLFLGWSLGANDAANVFGTAVGSKMVRFKTAALICSIFVILGAVVGGAGAAHTLGSLGSVNAVAGAFMVALSAAFTVFWMTRLKLPVSTSQAIVGAIIGWNIYTDSLTDQNALIEIISTWAFAPVLSAIFAIIMFLAVRAFLDRAKIHLLKLDMYTRVGLIVAGAFGSYSLGANNIANVMGVFIPVSPFSNLDVYGLFTITGTQQLFFIGALAIAVGVYTYSHKVMLTIGKSLLKLSPISALIVIMAQGMVLFLFSSEGLESWLVSLGLPSIPLVPLSSSQAVIGAIIGIGIVKGGKGIRYRVLGEISVGWVITPVIACIITFIALFFLQNVFKQEVNREISYSITPIVLKHLNDNGIDDIVFTELSGKTFNSPIRFESVLKRETNLSDSTIRTIIISSEIDRFYIDPLLITAKIDRQWFTPAQIDALRHIKDNTFFHKWQLNDALEHYSDEWALKDSTIQNKVYNKDLLLKRQNIYDIFRQDEDPIP